MAEGEVGGYFRDKAREIAIHVCTVIADTALLAIWLIGEYCFEHYLVPKFPAETSITRASLYIFRLLFAVSTLLPCITNVYKHARIQLIRNKAAIRKVKEELSKQAVAAGGNPEVSK